MEKNLKRIPIFIVIPIITFSFLCFTAIMNFFTVKQANGKLALEKIEINGQNAEISDNTHSKMALSLDEGQIEIKTNENWHIDNITYYKEDNLGIKIIEGKKGKYSVSDTGNEKEAYAVSLNLNENIQFGHCCTHFYIYLNNTKNNKKFTYYFTIFSYNEIAIKLGEMIDGKTTFNIELEQYLNQEYTTDTFHFTYNKSAEENDYSSFKDKESLIKCIYGKVLLFSPVEYSENDYPYEEKDGVIYIKYQKDYGIRSVNVENAGKGTKIQIIS